MKTKAVDLLIIGAGPAGMSAAVEARNNGLSVLVLDEQPGPGGQIYRNISNTDAQRSQILGADYSHGRHLAQAFLASDVEYVAQASVWQVTDQNQVHYLHQGQSRVAQGQRLLIATGAYERPMPIPGWTLPGVMTAGAGQILLKSAAMVPAGPVVLAGCGPLLYLLAVQYLQAGISLAALVDTSRHSDVLSGLRHIPKALKGWPDLQKGLSLLATLRKAKVKHYRGATALRIEGSAQAEALSFNSGGDEYRVACKLVMLHQGVVPNTQISWSLRLQHHWQNEQLCWQAERNAWGETSTSGIFIAGDGGSIGGAMAAQAQGRIAALAIACQLGRIDSSSRDKLVKPYRKALHRCMAVRPLIDALYRPRDENRIPEDNVIACRCEEVTAGTVRSHVRLGCLGPNQIKAFSRCGMGPCQGRQCGLTVTEIIAASGNLSASEVGYYRIRAPLKPITLKQLAQQPNKNLNQELS